MEVVRPLQVARLRPEYHESSLGANVAWSMLQTGSIDLERFRDGTNKLQIILPSFFFSVALLTQL